MLSPKKKRKINPMLINVLLISGGIHALAIFILGGITIYKYIIPDEAQFEEAPEIAEEQPPPDVKVEIKPQAPPPQATQSLRMKQVGNIAVSDVNVDLPSMEQSFTVSSGLGSFGGGSLLGGTSGSIGIGMSDVSVFGLKTKAERILFVIDTGRPMIVDAKGGLNSYKAIKDEITDMVGNLSAGTLFNVMLFDKRDYKLFRPQLTPAGQDIHQALIKWITPINQNANFPGLERAASAGRARISALSNESIHKHISWDTRATNERMYITQAAIEQQVDAIFLITSEHQGFEGGRRRLTELEEEDWQRTIAQKSYQDQLAAHQIEVPQMERKITNRLNYINKERAAKGQPPRILSRQHGIYTAAREIGLEWNVEHPGWRPVIDIKSSLMENYFKKVLNTLYTEKGAKSPSVNVVLLMAKGEEMRKGWEGELKDFVRFFRGKYRIIRGLDEIRSASSAKSTTN